MRFNRVNPPTASLTALDGCSTADTIVTTNTIF